ncbi:MAG: dephospho-CoA kinase [Flavobacteriales bacterium]|jgi:dephospho-CoA kinase|nr:dephospho-CoA kinase [Flavobacteriales bacterium]
MKIVGLTGGIGSGKSKALTFFKNKGIPCYQADLAGHKVLNENPEVKAKVKAYFGSEIYTSKGLDRKALGKQVFNNQEALQFLNGIVHPAVRLDFQNFIEEQQAPFIVSEVAILFENGGEKRYDKIILLTAPEALRIERVMARDGVSETEVRQRMQNQWTDAQKIPLADYVIDNTDWTTTENELERVYKELLQ